MKRFSVGLSYSEPSMYGLFFRIGLKQSFLRPSLQYWRFDVKPVDGATTYSKYQLKADYLLLLTSVGHFRLVAGAGLGFYHLDQDVTCQECFPDAQIHFLKSTVTKKNALLLNAIIGAEFQFSHLLLSAEVFEAGLFSSTRVSKIYLNPDETAVTNSSLLQSDGFEPGMCFSVGFVF